VSRWGALPDGSYFVGIGAQHSGSSWLGRYLFAHPQVWANPVREMHLFDRLYAPAVAPDMLGWYANRRAQVVQAEDRARREPDEVRRNVALQIHEHSREAIDTVVAMAQMSDRDEATETYVRYFADRVGEDARCFGELTPAYCLLPKAGFEAIVQLRPEARILFVLRDPVDRHWSGIRQRSFYDSTWDASAEFDRVHRLDRHVLRSRYDLTLEALDGVVASEQLLVVFYEDLFDPDSDRTLHRVTDFLGLDPVEGDRSAVVHRGSAVTMSPGQEETVLELLAPTYRAVSQRMDHLPVRWQERLDRLG
jgi:Sulfotransferase family